MSLWRTNGSGGMKGAGCQTFGIKPGFTPGLMGHKDFRQNLRTRGPLTFQSLHYTGFLRCLIGNPATSCGRIKDIP